MIRFLLRRLIFAAGLVAAASSAALLLTRLAPGDVTTQLGPFASPREIAATRERFDLNRGALGQWRLWASRAVRFDLGESFLYGRPVRPLVAGAALNTAVLGTSALLVATLAGIALGIFTGSRRGGVVPSLVRGASLVLLSLPPLLSSLLLVFIAARTGWLPVGGMTDAGTDAVGGAWWLEVVSHLPVPMLALALPMAATFERLQSQSISEALQEPFVLAGRARGVPVGRLILRHAFPVALRPVAGVYGIAVGTLLSGSFVVEYVTAWPGLGRLTYEALRARDIYLVSGCAAMGSAFLALGTLAGDLLLAVADPRLRHGERA